MIPYFQFTTIQLGPLTLYVWGLFVALGFLVGLYVAKLRAKKLGLDEKIVVDIAFWLITAGFVGGRLGYVLFYDLSTFIENPLQIFQVWDGGMSFFGGLILAVGTGVWFLRKKKVDVYKYSDAMIFGLPIGIFIGRIGCFLIHDHPGTATDFILGVEYPDGVVRHDHGLYLSLSGLALAGVFLWISRKKRPVGTYIAVFSIWYGTVRFLLDFMRTIDVRYAGLTPGQYFSILLLGFGLWYFYKLTIKK